MLYHLLWWYTYHLSIFVQNYNFSLKYSPFLSLLFTQRPIF